MNEQKRALLLHSLHPHYMLDFGRLYFTMTHLVVQVPKCISKYLIGILLVSTTTISRRNFAQFTEHSYLHMEGQQTKCHRRGVEQTHKGTNNNEHYNFLSKVKQASMKTIYKRYSTILNACHTLSLESFYVRSVCTRRLKSSALNIPLRWALQDK